MFFFCIKQRGKVEFYYCPLSHLELRTFDGAKVGKKRIREKTGGIFFFNFTLLYSKNNYFCIADGH